MLVCVGALALACARGDAATLRPPSASACVRDLYLLELPSGGGFRLNREVRDSAGVARWLRDILPRRSGTGQTVHVRVEGGREAELRWLVPAITQAGGTAYEYDPSCRIEIP